MSYIYTHTHTQLGLKHTRCKYINDANDMVTLAKFCGQKRSIEQLEPNVKTVPSQEIPGLLSKLLYK